MKGFGVVLFLIFLILKLTHQINWSWWWITSPLWIPLAVSVLILMFVGIIALLYKNK